MAEGNKQNVSLGCGTLILIAIIVAIFSGAGRVEELEGKIDDLTEQVRVLQQKVDALPSLLGSTEAEQPLSSPEAAAGDSAEDQRPN
jgi:hypothetical protein